MAINKGTIATLCLGWAFAVLLGVSVGLNVPFVLLVAWTILLLIG
ncbi:MAG TPA: hypothetical protein VFU31_05445 [Candidatus Binatia bacterium]|nr:hypothetical protein [Candidatus Binatia bacterium]